MVASVQGVLGCERARQGGSWVVWAVLSGREMQGQVWLRGGELRELEWGPAVGVFGWCLAYTAWRNAGGCGLLLGDCCGEREQRGEG